MEESLSPDGVKGMTVVEEDEHTTSYWIPLERVVDSLRDFQDLILAATRLPVPGL